MNKKSDSRVNMGYKRIIRHKMVGFETMSNEWEERNNKFGVVSDQRIGDKAIDDCVGNHYKKYGHEDVIWFVCTYNGCEFGDTNEEVMVSHVRQHLSEQQLKDSDTKSNANNEDIKDSKDINDEQRNEVISERQTVEKKREKKVRFASIVEKIVVNSNNEREDKKKSVRPINDSTSEVKSHKQTQNNARETSFGAEDVEQYIERIPVCINHNKIVNERKHLHRCKWKGCDYSTYDGQKIVRHIHDQHIAVREFKCSHTDCGKTFSRRESLAEHEKKHFCGFHIVDFLSLSKIRYGNGACSYSNIKKYYEQIRSDEANVIEYSFKCLWSGCTSMSARCADIQTHIHDTHVCPHRNSAND